jgi:hypothetical protein
MKPTNAHSRTTFWTMTLGIGLFFFVGVATAVYAHRDLLHPYTIPGLLSGVNHSGEALGGFSSHAMFEQDCVHCHAPVHCITDNKCQECHLDIARQRVEAVGLHSLLPGTEKCQTCHVEHRGREAVISQVLFKNINHQALSGFSLSLHETGYDGAAMVCEDCHTQGRFARDEVNCAACHQEAQGELIAEHSAEHGEDCLGCHDGTRYIIEFPHDDVYALEAGHTDLGCVDCHQNQVFVGTARTCDGCHAEPNVHAGQFGQECERCHSAIAWAPAQLTQHRFNLAHGEGDLLACNSCHTLSYTAVSCEGCHTLPDMQTAHPPERAPDYQPADCLTCHPTGDPADTAPLVQVGN